MSCCSSCYSVYRVTLFIVLQCSSCYSVYRVTVFIMSLDASAKYFGHVGEILGLVGNIFWNLWRGFGHFGGILNYDDL